jgi:hypothetical protein
MPRAYGVTRRALFVHLCLAAFRWRGVTWPCSPTGAAFLGSLPLRLAVPLVGQAIEDLATESALVGVAVADPPVARARLPAPAPTATPAGGHLCR